MASNRKYHVNGSVLFITFTVEEGLLLLANPLLELIIKGCLAHAQYHYPVTICHFLIEATHIHLVVVVDNPDDIKDFIGRFKTESAHRINTLLGRNKRTLWCESYHSPPVLTAEDVVNKIVYTYINPAKDNLVDSIKDYPGLSSWKMYQEGALEKEWVFPPRIAYKPLTKDQNCLRGMTKEARLIRSSHPRKLTFKLSPDAWMDCFEINDKKQRAAINTEISEKIDQEELSYRQERIKKKWQVMGEEQLLKQPLDSTFQSKRNRESRRMWCICSDIELRTEFIQFLKSLFEKASEVYLLWKRGEILAPYPLGLYPPSMPKLKNPISLFH